MPRRGRRGRGSRQPPKSRGRWWRRGCPRAPSPQRTASARARASPRRRVPRGAVRRPRPPHRSRAIRGPPRRRRRRCRGARERRRAAGASRAAAPTRGALRGTPIPTRAPAGARKTPGPRRSRRRRGTSWSAKGRRGSTGAVSRLEARPPAPIEGRSAIAAARSRSRAPSSARRAAG